MIPHSKPWINDEDRRRVDEVIGSGMVAQGKVVERLEVELARVHGAAGAVAVGSGTAALELILRALGVGAADEVVLPSYVCVNVLQAVRAVGAEPVFADIGVGWAMDVAEIGKVVSPRTRAIVAVHLFGIASDVEPMCQFGVPVVEDCCQALGARRGQRLAGTTGQAAFFSFHGTKCLTTGEGGIALSSSAEMADAMRRSREGAGPDGARRVSAPMSDVQAALGLSQLVRYPEFLSRRMAIAERYFAHLPPSLTARLRALGNSSMYFRFPLYASEISAAGDIEALAARAIAARHGVDALLHRRAGLSDAAFPHTVETFAHTLSIPIYPSLSESDQERVISAVRAHYAN